MQALGLLVAYLNILRREPGLCQYNNLQQLIQFTHNRWQGLAFFLLVIKVGSIYQINTMKNFNLWRFLVVKTIHTKIIKLKFNC